jgi:hypothetical protein
MVAQPAGAVLKVFKDTRCTENFKSGKRTRNKPAAKYFFSLQLASAYVVCYYPAC